MDLMVRDIGIAFVAANRGVNIDGYNVRSRVTDEKNCRGVPRSWMHRKYKHEYKHGDKLHATLVVYTSVTVSS